MLQGISNSRAIVHHLQHLQGLDKDDRWQFAVLYFCFVDIGSILNTFQGLVIHSFLLQKSPRCMSDTKSRCCRFVAILVLFLPQICKVHPASGSSKIFFTNPLTLDSRHVKWEHKSWVYKPQKLTSGLPKRNRTQVQNCWDWSLCCFELHLLSVANVIEASNVFLASSGWCFSLLCGFLSKLSQDVGKPNCGNSCSMHALG